MFGALTYFLFFAAYKAFLGSIPDYRPVADGKGRAFYSEGKHIVFDSASAFNSVNVDLLAQIDLAAFSASSGNDCWGYVSPSGREYALVGLNNKIAFVEVTDPSNPNYFADIPHGSSTWGDVKVYQDHCYVVTERSGSGTQVIDMSDIDNGNVTLVRTLTSPGRSHNVAVDTFSGFLYTSGSRGGTGTTTCFDLTDPSNPVQVGANSMTGSSYQHDVAPVTFTEGPFAGRQILFGNGESRGVEIWDVTDKASPFLVKRQNYGNVGYSHQGWLSEDRQYWYINDELDERNSGVLTRTLVFDVSDINNPTLVNTFTTSLPAIDHNLYTKGGFIFESNYTSGVRIFDANDDPVDPTETGWFDTHPEDDSTNFRGTWSNYPYLPSGTLIVNDINRGLFVLDPSNATVRTATASSYNIVRGVYTAGDLASVSSIDGNYLAHKAGVVLTPNEAPINLTFDSTAPWSHASKMSIVVGSKSDTPGVSHIIEIYDWDAGSYVEVHSEALGFAVNTNSIQLSNPDRFIQTGTNLMRTRIRVKQTGATLVWPWVYSIDQLTWSINP